eukprot:g16412.t2
MDSSTSRSRLGIHAPGLPDSAIALAERLLSAKSPGEVLTLGTKAVEALHTEVDQEQRSLRLGQIALSLQLLARQADGPRKAVILKDRRLAGMVESLKENAEELEVWILAAGSCALGRLASLSLGAAQATGPAHEALLACSQKKLSTFEVAQAALVLASLASVPERLASPVGRQLRESLVSTLELQSQDTRCCGAERWGADWSLVDLNGGYELRDQSAELAKGVAKRLGTGVSAVPPELLATAAKSLAALRQAPLQLMEATEQFEGLDPTYKMNEEAQWEPQDPDPGPDYVWAHALFYFIGVGITILLMNLLVGVLGQNFELYEEQSAILFYRARAKMLLELQARPWKHIFWLLFQAVLKEEAGSKDAVEDEEEVDSKDEVEDEGNVDSKDKSVVEPEGVNERCAGRFTCAHPVQWSTSPRLCRRAGAGWTPSRTS